MLAADTRLHQNGLEHPADERGAIPASLAYATGLTNGLEPKRFSFSDGS
jgi:hypothetical protein